MPTTSKRIISMLCCLALLLCLLPAVSSAVTAQAIQPICTTHINSLYAHALGESDLVQPGTMAAEVDEYHTSTHAAGEAVRVQLETRQETVTVGLQATEATEQQIADVFEAALSHTGVPTQGDYLRWQYGGYKGSLSGYIIGNTYYLTLTYAVTYYTTAQQESEMDAAVDSLLSGLALGGSSDYAKVKGVYDWICTNVTYDNDNLADTAYKRKHTAYAALMDKTAVCQGYAILLYRLLLELGIDNRVISGTGNGGGHGWNIIKLGASYYNADATWDATYSQAGLSYAFFLKNTESFADHTRDTQYDSAAFHAAYPMSSEDYVSDAPVASGTCGKALAWSLEANGTLTVSGTGAMTDYTDTYAPWYRYAESIHTAVIDNGVTTVGKEAFYGCTALTAVSIGTDVTSIRDEAFYNCTALSQVSMGSKVALIGSYAFRGCRALEEMQLPAGVTYIGSYAFSRCAKLKALTLPESATSIGSDAFSYCTNLTELRFTGNAPTIGAYAFYDCTADIYYPAGNETWTSSAMDDYGGTVFWFAAVYPGASLQDAIDNSSEGAYITLLTDVQEDLSVSKRICLDLNSYDITGSITIDRNTTLSCFDSATADYDCDNDNGYGSIIGTVTGNLTKDFVTDKAAANHSYRYLTIQEETGSYSFHRIYLAVKSVVLVPSYAAINYRTTLKCDRVAGEHISAYGVEYTPQSGDALLIPFDTAIAYCSDKDVQTNLRTSQIKNFLHQDNTVEENSFYASAIITARAYITVSDASCEKTLFSAAAQSSLADMVRYASNSWDSQKEAAQNALIRLYRKYASIMSAWEGIDTLKGNAQ